MNLMKMLKEYLLFVTSYSMDDSDKFSCNFLRKLPDYKL